MAINPSQNLFNIPENSTYNLLTGYAKIYPDSTKLYMLKNPIMVKQSGYEEINPKPKTKRKTIENSDPLVWYTSLRRTKTRLSDIVLSNNFQLFVTFTFKEDRQNIDLIKYRMQRWLKNEQRKLSTFQYLIVPEFHKDGKSIHFHALLQNYQGPLTDSGHKRKDGRTVYNIDNYTLGFSTATKIDSNGTQLVSSYIKKYILKDMPQFNSKKRYWCSQKLNRPLKIQNPVLFPQDQHKFTKTYEMKHMLLHISDQKIDLSTPIM